MALVSLTTVDGDALNIGSDTILMVIEQGSERKVLWDNKGIDAEQVLVTDDLATITGVGEAENLYQVTIDGITVALDKNKTVAVAAYGAGSKVFYAGKGRDLDEYITAEDPATVEDLIDPAP
jgi:hypothetical protein